MNNKTSSYGKFGKIPNATKNFRSRNMKLEFYAAKQERNDTTKSHTVTPTVAYFNVARQFISHTRVH